MSPPISYYGGKQRMASKIIPYITKHTVYVEPFCGGATILFKKPYPQITDKSHYREVINDIDGNLINFFKQLRDNGEELTNKISLTLYSSEEHKISKDFNVDDDLERARRYYVNIQQSFASKLNSGWGFAFVSKNNAPTWKNKINQLADYIDRMQGVYIENIDAIECIEKWDSPQTFFYIDPPYIGADQGHYSGYTEKDYQKLINELKTVQGSFILSNYNSYADIPSDWEKIEFQAHCAASRKGKAGAGRNKSEKATDLGNRKRTEVIYIKQRSAPLRPDLYKLLYETDKYSCFTGDAKDFENDSTYNKK